MQALLDQISEAFNARTDREQKLVLVTGVALAIFLLLGAFWWTESAVDTRLKTIKVKKEQLALVQSKEGEYKAAEQAEEQAKKRLKSNNISLFSKLQSAAQKQGLQLRDLNERKVPVKGAETIEQVSVEVNLQEVSIDALNQFLEEIEGRRKNGLVKITKLKVLTRHDNDQMLKVNMTVATWKEAG